MPCFVCPAAITWPARLLVVCGVAVPVFADYQAVDSHSGPESTAGKTSGARTCPREKGKRFFMEFHMEASACVNA